MPPLDIRPQRRTGSLLTAAVAAALVFTSCSPSTATDTAPSGEQAQTSLLPPAEGTTQYPLTLESPWGETVLAERPERIAVLGNSFNIDVLLALDALPVFATERAVFPSWVPESTISQVEHIDEGANAADYSIESLAAVEPDLIIMFQYINDLDSEIEKLSVIAPVLTFPEEVLWNEVDWREAQRITGQALDLTASSEEAISNADASLSALASQHPEFSGRTVSVAYDYEEQGLAYYTVPGSATEEFFLPLGFAPNPLPPEDFGETINVSDEQVALIDGDVLLMFYDSEETRTAREASPLFQSLNAVSSGRYVSLVPEPDDLDVSSAVWALRGSASIVGMPWAVNYLVALIDDVDLS